MDYREYAEAQAIETAASRASLAGFMSKVYAWMSIALLITAITAVWVASTPALVELVMGNRIVFFGLLLGQLGLVVVLAGLINRITSATAVLVFLFYACMVGITFSIYFLIFTAGSIASTFFITAGTFGAMSLYGYFTKSDLTKWGNLLLMGLVGIILASVVNMFWHNETLYWVTTYIGVLVFVGLIAYDTQKIKAIGMGVAEGSEEGKKASIMGALSLYLDFINLFIMLLRIFGSRR